MQESELESSMEIELSDAKKAVGELTLRIEEANLRTKQLQRKQPKWRQQEETETYDVKTEEDISYVEVMNEIKQMKHEMHKLKADMARVLKEKRHAERATRASNSKRSTLLASMDLMKKELQELDEEQTMVEFARIEAVNECKLSPELDATEHKDLMQLAVCDKDIVRVEESPLTGAKKELASVKGEGIRFMTSMDVIRDELIRVKEEKVRLKEAEQKQELTVQSLNSKILRAKAKLEALTSAESRTNTVVSNLVVTLEQLREEAETAKKDRDIVNEQIENMKAEIAKTEYEIDVAEDSLEAAVEELKEIKSSESKAMGSLRNLINGSVEARDTCTNNNSSMTIRITNFEYEYLTGKAGRAAELADKKIGAAQAWVEALKASENELMMKIEMAQKEISELSIEVDEVEEGPGLGLREKVVASPRRSMGKVRKKVSVKRVSLEKVRSPAARNLGKMGSGEKEKKKPKFRKYFSTKSVAMNEEMV